MKHQNKNKPRLSFLPLSNDLQLITTAVASPSKENNMTLKTRGDKMLLKYFSLYLTILSDTTANHTTGNMPDQTLIHNFNISRKIILLPLRHTFDAIASRFSCSRVCNVAVALSLNVICKRDNVNQNILLKEYSTNH